MTPVAEPQAQATADVDLAHLARAYSGVLRRFFERRILERADVDDLVQEVFLRLTRRGDLSGIISVEGYLFETAANVLRDRARQRLTRKADAHQELDQTHSEVNAFSPERLLIGREGIDRLAVALKELPERTRNVFMLRQFEELRYPAVAERLGISISTAEKEMAKAMAHLLMRLKDYL